MRSTVWQFVIILPVPLGSKEAGGGGGGGVLCVCVTSPLVAMVMWGVLARAKLVGRDPRRRGGGWLVVWVARCFMERLS